MQQQYPGHAQQVGALAAQCAAGACWRKFIVVVDEDIDPSDLEQVTWAIATRCSAAETGVGFSHRLLLPGNKP
jgi:4-hydroxy-3-polyprenylbenzoate decarboxylase